MGRTINPLQPLLAGIFRIPERRIRLEPEEMRELFFDATERPARRPTAFDPGKKKRHPLKTQVMMTRRIPSSRLGPGAASATLADRGGVEVVPRQRP